MNTNVLKSTAKSNICTLPYAPRILGAVMLVLATARGFAILLSRFKQLSDRAVDISSIRHDNRPESIMYEQSDRIKSVRSSSRDEIVAINPGWCDIIDMSVSRFDEIELREREKSSPNVIFRLRQTIPNVPIMSHRIDLLDLFLRGSCTLCIASREIIDCKSEEIKVRIYILIQHRISRCTCVCVWPGKF